MNPYLMVVGALVLSAAGCYLAARTLVRRAGYTASYAGVVTAVGVIALGAAAQSYTNLVAFAQAGAAPWPSGRLDQDHRLAELLTTVEPSWAAYVWPIGLDVFAVMAYGLSLHAREANRRDRRLSAFALIYGALTLACQVVPVFPGATAIIGPYIPAVVRLLPAATMLLAGYVLHREASRGRRAEDGHATDGAPAAAVEATVSAHSEERRDGVAARDLVPSAPPPRTPEARSKRAMDARRAPAGERQRQLRELLAEPEGRGLTSEQIGERLGINAGYARRLRAEVEGADPELGRRPRVVQVEAAAPVAVAEEVSG